jgi:peptidoglycan/xylan/chitin deacetylase (PgdA/CDA1 family)
VSRLAELTLRGLAGLLSPAGPHARLSILIYHRVLPEIDPINDWDPTAEVFTGQMRAVAAHFNVLPLGEAAARLRVGTLPARAACVTFDDGYADNAEVALPILARLGVPATFFLATGYLNGGRMFNDTVIEAIRRTSTRTIALDDATLGPIDVSTVPAKRRSIKKVLSAWKHLPPRERDTRADELAARVGAELPRDLMMRDDQVRRLRTAGMEIGAHSVTHSVLTSVSRTDAQTEITASRDYLQSLLGEPVYLFAYPNGRPHQDYSAEHVRIVRDAGFDAAVSTARGVADASADLHQLPRFTPWDRDPLRFAARLVGNLGRRPGDLVSI